MENNKLLTEKEWLALYEKKQAKERKSVIAGITQKLCGLLLLMVAIIAPFVCNGDCTVSVVFAPLSLYLIFTREKLIELF